MGVVYKARHVSLNRLAAVAEGRTETDGSNLDLSTLHEIRPVLEMLIEKGLFE